MISRFKNQIFTNNFNQPGIGYTRQNEAPPFAMGYTEVDTHGAGGKRPSVVPLSFRHEFEAALET